MAKSGNKCSICKTDLFTNNKNKKDLILEKYAILLVRKLRTQDTKLILTITTPLII